MASRLALPRPALSAQSSGFLQGSQLPSRPLKVVALKNRGLTITNDSRGPKTNALRKLRRNIAVVEKKPKPTDKYADVTLPESGTGLPGLDLNDVDGQNKTYYAKEVDTLNKNKTWYVVDAEGQTLGRLATLVANHLRGKNQPFYQPSMDMGGYVIIINCEKVQVSGAKFTDKIYKRHTTGRPGSMKEESFKDLQRRLPERILEKAVKGMIPHTRLGRKQITKLKVYKGADHPHQKQCPIDITCLIDTAPKDVAIPVA